ncbi:MAG: DUF2194 domain-containing protein [Ruthenibacterium sp.]
MKLKFKIPKLKFRWLFSIIIGYMLICVVVFTERAGVQYVDAVRHGSIYLPPQSITLTTINRPKNCLVLYDSGQKECVKQMQEWRVILDSMDVGYTEKDVAHTPARNFAAYEKVIVAMPDLTPMTDAVPSLMQWTKNGGQTMFSAALAHGTAMQGITQKIGIYESDYQACETKKLVVDDFMIGGNQTFLLEDTFESSLRAQLSQDCTVHIAAQDANPILWERPYEKGKFVVMNLGFSEPATRGLYAAAYSLLGDVCVYPVINSSTFYIDDFPSPVPGGVGTYVQKEFNRDIASFYTNVWWPDMLQFSQDYGIRYTGVVIENYEDEVNAPFVRNTDTDRFQFFGGNLLRNHGEIGLHGYNHQPLVLENFDYKGEEDYAKWPDEAAMAASLTELHDFCSDIFPDEKFHVYVPPSNILSDEGRKTLADTLPDLQAIASLYFKTGIGYAQEYSVSEDGIVEMPRIVSGAELSDFMKLAVLSELNFHYVNSHFMHPDDLLDPDRGAALGWTYLRGTFEEYLQYLQKAAPHMRQQVASEEVGAVQRYCYAEVTQNVTDTQITVDITNFFDEAFCLLRVNAGEIGKVTGGTLEHLTDNLYLLSATDSHVTIAYEREG